MHWCLRAEEIAIQDWIPRCCYSCVLHSGGDLSSTEAAVRSTDIDRRRVLFLWLFRMLFMHFFIHLYLVTFLCNTSCESPGMTLQADWWYLVKTGMTAGNKVVETLSWSHSLWRHTGFRNTGFLDFFHRPEVWIQENTIFWKLDLFPSSAEVEDTYSVGSLRKS
jgi:hypothetical protein